MQLIPQYNIGSIESVSVVSLPGWRKSAAKLAAELLCSVRPEAADEMLDLRSALMDFNVSAESLLQTFLTAKNRLEQDHYLLFFRLRRVLEPSLGIKCSGSEMVEPIDFRTRCVTQLKRRAQQSAFEHDLALASPMEARASIEWRLPPVLQSI